VGSFCGLSSFLSLFIDIAAAVPDATYIVAATAGDKSASAMCIVNFLRNIFLSQVYNVLKAFHKPPWGLNMVQDSPCELLRRMRAAFCSIVLSACMCII
jgi:hypothetical protein